MPHSEHTYTVFVFATFLLFFFGGDKVNFFIEQSELLTAQLFDFSTSLPLATYCRVHASLPRVLRVSCVVVAVLRMVVLCPACFA